MSIKKYHIISTVITVISGVLLHFAYDLFPKDFTAIFTPVNESTWEHLKLLFYPVVILTVAEYFIYCKNIPNFCASRVISLLLGMLFIVTVFYTYTGITGKSYDFINILIYVGSAILTYYLSYCFIELGVFETPLINKIAPIIVIGIFILFWVFTFYAPLINIFRDPITGSYGI